MQRFFNYFRITSRSAIVTIVILLVLDLVVRSHWSALFRQPGKVRLVNSELESLQRMKHEIKKAKGYKIVFLGDSQTYGSAVKDSSKTIPAYLEQNLMKSFPDKQIKVFNYAFKGYGISENYFIINSLTDADVDLFIYNISTSWFNRNKVLEHPNVVLLSDYYPDANKLAGLGIRDKRSYTDKLSNQVSLLAGQVWSLYQNKSAITVMLLGKTVREKLTEWQLSLTNPKEALKKQEEEKQLFLPWYLKDWDKKIGKEKYVFGTVNLNNNNPQVFFYKSILNLLGKNKVNALFYNSPQNMKLIGKYYGIDEESWQQSKNDLKLITQNKNVAYLDYTDLVPDSNFSDTIHLDSKGNELVAKQLAADITKNRKW